MIFIYVYLCLKVTSQSKKDVSENAEEPPPHVALIKDRTKKREM